MVPVELQGLSEVRLHALLSDLSVIYVGEGLVACTERHKGGQTSGVLAKSIPEKLQNLKLLQACQEGRPCQRSLQS